MKKNSTSIKFKTAFALILAISYGLSASIIFFRFREYRYLRLIISYIITTAIIKFLCNNLESRKLVTTVFKYSCFIGLMLGITYDFFIN